jgi:hypothetical protein
MRRDYFLGSLTHGEDGGRGALLKLIQQRYTLTTTRPRQGEVIEI